MTNCKKRLKRLLNNVNYIYEYLVQFLSGYAEMCDQNYNRSLAEFNQIPM